MLTPGVRYVLECAARAEAGELLAAGVRLERQHAMAAAILELEARLIELERDVKIGTEGKL